MKPASELSGRVLVTGDSVAPRFIERLKAAGLEVENPPASYPPAILSEAELARHLEPCVGYLLGSDEVATDRVLAAAGDLRALAFLGIGYESQVDTAAAARAGIRVTNTPGVLANAVAEFTIGMLLDARRQITEYLIAEEAGVEMPQLKRRDLAGHAVGVIGLGAIGTRVCEILTQGFKAEVRYFSRTRKPEEEERIGIAYASLPELVAEVESLIVMLPETPATTGLVDREVLAGRAEDSHMLLVNTSRPDVVEPLALGWALDTGRVETAWFDGHYRERSEATRALEARNDVRVTPHVASLTHDARDAMADIAVGSLLNLLRGEEDSYVVN